MTGHIAFSVIALVAAVFMARYFMRTGIICQFCGDIDCKVWDRVADDVKVRILEYFRSYEKRSPDTSGIFVCDECKTVFDDFSGERASRDVDSVTVSRGLHTRSIVTCRTWCKVCNSLMQSCDPDNPSIRCRTCGTGYEWKTHEESGYRFLMPPENAKILERCDDLAGIA